MYERSKFPPGPDPDGLPDHLKEAPEVSYKWDFPTAWLLGTRIIGSLRDIALSAVFDIDPREWMTAENVDHIAAKRPDAGHEPEGCWIDFLADSGDSARLVYQLAYLLQQPELSVCTPLRADGERHSDVLTFADGSPRRLPRGSLLIFGGDTAYPVATRNQLVARIRAPFIWARRKLEGEGKAAPRQPAVPVVAIPGNHDYYNMLNGYQRQFRTLARDSKMDPHMQTPRLDVPGYSLAQQASYFAIDLPYGWQLWALDVEKGLDERQRDYFVRQKSSKQRILVTSRPAVVYHAISKHGTALATTIKDKLGITPGFDRDGVIPADEIRLDLSGDDHTYERYWGSGPDGAPSQTAPKFRRRQLPMTEIWTGDTTRGNEVHAQDSATARSNYASVVSGLGGAFHHPGQIRFGEITPQAAWPPAEASARAIGERLIRPRKVFQAGAVGIIGIVVAVLCAWLAYRSDSHNLLDVPFLLPDCPHELRVELRNLLAIASIALTIAAMGGIAFGAVKLGQHLAKPIASPDPPTGRWARFTYALAYDRFIFWCLRWVGGNRRTTWSFLITFWAWAPAIALEGFAIYLLGRCPLFVEANTEYIALYVVTTLMMLIMFGVAFGIGGSGRNFAVRIAIGIVGLVVGALIVWTPYAWMRVIMQFDWRSAIGLGVGLSYFGIRRGLLRTGYFSHNTTVRRLLAAIIFAVLVTYYVGMALVLRTDTPLSYPTLGYALTAVLGAYFACLWLGWYFFVCLQFNMHGNEAGSAARVVGFAEFLRIKLTLDAAEVWVIAAEPPEPVQRPWWRFWQARDAADHPIHARIVDHFVLRRE